ncbi:hypothetical protein [Alkalibacterium olivapovliticus]|uniref:Uncharacterized protein n=1 Tax=Alkalibacterium olivapovliticus TaxID=99907 RepID=A0A2T0W0X9_9LACT|nr:hypothetical protein [Alkalibacterium olivapovliticus]PRY78662.1 hypothetical protein CLV38_12533 [Alkalibacterium olivapovliticus]
MPEMKKRFSRGQIKKLNAHQSFGEDRPAGTALLDILEAIGWNHPVHHYIFILSLKL